MAASLSRPDPSSPASVAEAGFSTARRGFQQDEVRAFLVAVAAELGRLQERERQLSAELRDVRAAFEAAPSKLDEATVTEMLGEETVRVLQTARESASQIKVRAEENAARILREANDEANRLRQETEVDVARRRQEAAADAESEVALAKQQGREMVNEARAYRERVLADLDRRTTLARQQIEELIHGRDRLLQVFERARLVAVDVTAELRDVETPDELVNLTPTTGPVPLMVPNQRSERPVAATTADEPAAEERPEADASDDQVEAAGVVDADADVEADADTAGAHDEANTAETDTDADETDTDEAATDGIDTAELDTGEVDETDRAVSGQVGRDRDHNVVSLFRDRIAPEHADDAQPEGSDGAADAVDGLFARLRDELPDTGAFDTSDDAGEAEQITDTTEHAARPVETDTDTEAAADEADAEPADVVETAFTRRDEALVPLIVSAARKIKRVLADEQNLVLDTLRQKEPVTALDDLVPGVDEHTETYRSAIDGELIGAATAGAVELGAKDNRTLRNRLGRAGALDDANALMRTALIGQLRDRLERSIVDGAGDNEAITKRIRAVYREWKTQHIDSQLDDVFRFAHGGGVAVTAEPGTPMVWTIDPSEPACPDCEDNSLSGAVPAGEPFPTGDTAAPAHPGCRCLVLPAD